jgi:predicted MPP superfamily phosphohydrolase
MALQFAIVVLVAVFVTGAGHYALYARVFEPLLPDHPEAAALVVTVLWSITFFGFVVIRILPVSLRRYFEALMFTWMGYALFLLFACVPVLGVSWLLSFPISEAQTSAGILAVGTALSVVSYRIAAREQVVEVDIPVILPAMVSAQSPVAVVEPSDPAPHLRVVVISDVHVSGLVRSVRLARIAAQVNALAPDLIFVTGDLVDGSVRQLANEVRALEALSAPGGIYYVTGNHEYFSGAKQWKQWIGSNLGWTVLENSAVHVTHKGVALNILGIEDRHSLAGRAGMRKADRRMATAAAAAHESYGDGSAVNILLAHQPKDARALKDHPQIHLQVSGHTHSGQIWPFSLLVRKDQQYLQGLYALNGGQQLYVSQGTTFWGPPFRLGTHCEISLLKLYCAQRTT